MRLNAVKASRVLMHICHLIFTVRQAYCQLQSFLRIHTHDPFTTEETKWRTDEILTIARRYADRSGLIGIVLRMSGRGNDALCLS
jgi:hypothetical protein